MKNITFFRFSIITCLVALFSAPLGLYAADVFDEELTNLLAKPTITKQTLPDGSVISTVSVGGTSNDVVSGFVTLPDGAKLQFTKSAGKTTFVNLSNGSTSVCSGNSCNGNINVSPSVQSSFASASKSVSSSNFANGSDGGGGETVVIVSEKVPGATCVCYIGGSPQDDSVCLEAKVQERLYQCSVDTGMTSFQNMIAAITKWFIYITMLLGVLALAGAGILWAWGSDSEEYTKKAKGWAISIIIGLAILFTFRYILGFLAPWIFQ